MDYVRESARDIQGVKVTFLWCDEWCYIPELQMRQKWTPKKYTREFWDGVIPIPQHAESLLWHLYSENPRVWREGSDLFSLQGK